MTPETVELITRLGLPSVALVLMAYFFKKDVWPFLIEMWNGQQGERIREREDFKESLEKLAGNFLEAIKEEREASNKDREEFLDGLSRNTAELRNNTTELVSIRDTLEELRSAFSELADANVNRSQNE